MKSSNMTQALYKSLLMLKEIRVILLQRTGAVCRAEGSALAFTERSQGCVEPPLTHSSLGAAAGGQNTSGTSSSWTTS
jgi:hypothetical protein